MMKKRAGLTLIELIVAMALMGIVLGIILRLSGMSFMQKNAGEKQEVVFMEGRAMMSELQNTLRYADSDSISFPTAARMTYNTHAFDPSNDVAVGSDKVMTVTLELIQPDSSWGNKRQLKLTKELAGGGGTATTLLFPSQAEVSTLIAGGDFPVQKLSAPADTYEIALHYYFKVQNRYLVRDMISTVNSGVLVTLAQ